jgi:oligoendopeptidase F
MTKRDTVVNQSADTSAAEALGTLPEWDLSDLYPSIDSPLVAADLEATLATCTSP